LLISETAIKADSGIDLWHAVEFSSYGCALASHENSRSARAAAKLITGLRAGSNRVCPRRKTGINRAFLQYVLSFRLKTS